MRIAFIFPGQGSQSVGMLSGFAGNAAVAETIGRADRALGFPISELIARGPAEALGLTVNTQPALLAASTAFYAAWRAAGGAAPSMMAGHSLGEYSALCAAGSFTLEDAVRLVRYRAEVMQSAVPVGTGGMAAVIGLADEAVLEVCREASASGVVEAVNFNSPGQVVIAGENRALEAAVALARARGCRRAIPLAVSAPFHSSLLKPAAEKLGARLAATEVRAPEVPVFSDVDAELHAGPDDVRRRLELQACSPVQWVKIVSRMAAGGVTDVVECGPGKVLTGLVRRIAPGLRLHNLFDQASLEATLEKLH